MGCKIIAHRGANKKAPQNTIPAFIKAIEENADGFETDVHLTRDNVPVICHNYTIDATSDGVGEISSYTLEEIKKFDFGSYFSEDFADTPLPTLEEFLELTSKSDCEIINIELKCPREGMTVLVEKTLECIDKVGCLDKVLISSFSPEILKTVKAMNESCKTAFLYPTSQINVYKPVINPFPVVENISCDVLHPASAAVLEKHVKLAHEKGLKVNVWTVNEKKAIERLLDFGVDGLITDMPLETRQIVEEYESKKKEEEECLKEDSKQ